jgi:hypothetical protein
MKELLMTEGKDKADKIMDMLIGPDNLSVYPAAREYVDGRFVREEVPNRPSISASLYDYEYLPGIREVRMELFTLDESPLAKDQRTRELAGAIALSAEINPLIVVVDEKGPYILEGVHRYDALRLLGAKSFPAVVVIEE